MRPSLQKFNRYAVLLICLAFAVMLLASRHMTIVRGAGDSSLAGTINIPLGGSPVFVATGDVNGDTFLDIFAVDTATPYTLIRSNGAGGLLAPSAIPGVFGHYHELVDVNNDGRLDIIYLLAGVGISAPHTINLRYGNGTGEFGPAISSEFGTGLIGLKDIAVANFNNDAFMDVAISTSGPGVSVPGGGVFILVGNGNGGFTQSAFLTINSRGDDLVAADFNQDSMPDIVVLSLGAGCGEPFCSSALQFLPNDGAGNFPTRTVIPGGSFLLSETVARDVNNDGKLDVVGVRAGSVATALGNGDGTFSAGGSLNINTQLNPTSTEVADFNNDGKLDVALVKDLVYIVFGNGAGGFTHYINLFAGQSPVDLAVADFNGNGKPDLAVANGGSNSLSVLLDPGLSASARTQFDFDGDLKADIAVYRDGSTPNAPSVWHIFQSSTNTYLGVQLGANGDQPVPADYDNDGKAEIAVWRPSNGTWYTSTDAAINYGAFHWGMNGDIPIPGDFDGDGKADYAVYRPSNFIWYVLRSSDGGFQSQQFGTSTTKPLLGDFDGDGKTDYALYRPGATALASSFWDVIQSSNGAYIATQFGRGEDKPVPADYDGDGKSNIAVFRASEGAWYTSTNPAINYGASQWGTVGDVPAPADYDRDGKADLAVFRPGNSTWYIRRSTDGGISIRQWGVSSDKPVPASFIP